jgi:rhamnose utilization protein RhaD (predicted bifunctional aldolase and dehydrogenase)
VIVTLTNQPDGEAVVRRVFGDRVVVLPYVMPGFDLARLCAQEWDEQHHEGVVGMVLLNHGLFTFGAAPRRRTCATWS